MQVRKLVGVIFLVAAVADASLIIPTIQPADWSQYSNNLDAGLTSLGVYSQEYRLGVMNKDIARWLNLVHPQIEVTGGRLPILDSRPLYDSWFNDVSFFRGDLRTSGFNLSDEKPPLYRSYFVDDPRNVATTLFWLDWMGVKNLVFIQGEPTQGTLGIYRSNSFLNYAEEKTNGPEITTVGDQRSGTIAEESNAKVVGFVGGIDDYNLFLALLSYVGLGPSYVVPVMLSLSDLGHVPVDALLVSERSYVSARTEFDSIAASGAKVVVIPESPSSSGQGCGPSVCTLKASLGGLVRLGPTGSYNLLLSLLPSLIGNQTRVSSSVVTYPILSVPMDNWSIGRISPNVSLNTQNTAWESPRSVLEDTVDIRLPFSISKSDEASQIDLKNMMPYAVSIGNATVVMKLKSSVNAHIGLDFSSSNNFRGYEFDVQANRSVSLRLSASNFSNMPNPSNPLELSNSFYIVFRPSLNVTGGILEVAAPQILARQTKAYTYQLPGHLDYSPNSLILLSGAKKGNLSLFLGSQDLASATALDVQIQNGNTTVPLMLFSGRVSNFSQVMATSPVVSVSLVLLNQQTTAQLDHVWTDGNNVIVAGVKNGFKGVVLKETCYPNWVVSAINSAGDSSGVKYYFAGPGFMYVPLPSSAPVSLNLHFSPYDGVFFLSLGSAGIVTVALLLWASCRTRLHWVWAREEIKRVSCNCEPCTQSNRSPHADKENQGDGSDCSHGSPQLRNNSLT